MAEFVTIRRFQQREDAELAQAALESIGIGSMIHVENAEEKQSPASLLVRAEDADAVLDLLGVEGLDREHHDAA